MHQDSAKAQQTAEPQQVAGSAATDATPPDTHVPSKTRGTTTPPKTRGPSKTARLVALLSEGSGCDAATISAPFGWQAHTTRAAVSGLRKAGFDVAKEGGVEGEATRYRIVAAPEAKDTAPEVQDAGATP